MSVPMKSKSITTPHEGYISITIQHLVPWPHTQQFYEEKSVRIPILRYENRQPELYDDKLPSWVQGQQKHHNDYDTIPDDKEGQLEWAMAKIKNKCENDPHTKQRLRNGEALNLFELLRSK